MSSRKCCGCWEPAHTLGFPNARSPAQHNGERHIRAVMWPITLRTEFRTEVLQPETPHRFGRLPRTFPDTVPGLLAAENMSAAAHTGVDRLADPGQLGADLLDARTRVRQWTTSVQRASSPGSRVGIADTSPVLRECNRSRTDLST
jgi:hypothetical protein